MKPQIDVSESNNKLISAPCVLDWYEYLSQHYAEMGSVMKSSMWAAKAKNMRTAKVKDTDYVYDDSLWREIKDNGFDNS